MGLSIFEESMPLVAKQTLAPADTTTYKELVAADVSIQRVDAILVSSDSTAIEHVLVAFSNFAGEYPIGEVAIPVGAGAGGVPTVDLVPLLAPVAMGGLCVPPTYSIKVKATATVTAAKTLTLVALGGSL